MKGNLTKFLLLIAVLFISPYSPLSAQSYCSSSFSLTSYGYIINVSFESINNNSGGTSGGPVNYTAVGPANVTAGDTYTLSVTNSAGSDLSVTAFIDWNQNGTLDDSGEEYILTTAGSTAGPHTYSITVPFTALSGNTRMRVMLVYDDTPTPCATLTYGEAEDYTVNVTTVCAPPTDLSVTEIGGTSAILHWEQYGVTSGWTIKYGPSGFDPATAGTTVTTTEQPYTLSGLDFSTDYDFYITATCEETGEESDWSAVGSFTTICPTPDILATHDSSICGAGSVMLGAEVESGGLISWYADPEGTDLLSTGLIFNTPVITATTTYYAAAAFPGNPCHSTIQPVVATVKSVPVVDLGNDTTICTGVTYILNAGNPGSTYEWSTGATTQTIVADEEGTYTVTVTNDEGCSATDSRSFSSTADEMVEGFNFIPLFGSGWGTVQFFPINVDASVQYYEWNFGDDSPVNTEATPVHTYAGNGNYDVRLTVGNECFRWEVVLPISVEVTTGLITLNGDAYDIVLYPNPSQNLITVENRGSNLHFKEVQVYNILGQAVYNADLNSTDKFQIPVNGFASGIYSLQIVTDKGSLLRKFEVIH